MYVNTPLTIRKKQKGLIWFYMENLHQYLNVIKLNESKLTGRVVQGNWRYDPPEWTWGTIWEELDDEWDEDEELYCEALIGA